MDDDVVLDLGQDEPESTPHAGTPNEELEQRARESGWVPKEEYRGAKPWVPAKNWVDRSEQILPIMKAQNAGLKADLERERASRQALEAQVRLQSAAVKALENAQQEGAKLSYEEARLDLKAQIAEASREGEHERVADLVDKLTSLKPPVVAKESIVTSDERTPAGLTPEFQTWQTQNSWYGSDARKTGLANGIGIELAQKGLRGADFYRELDKELAKELRPARSTTRVSGNGDGSRTVSSGGAKSYHDLTAEEKTACDSFAAQVVGPRKKFKTVDAWRAAYAAELSVGESV